jgi:hypothetical protein
MIQGALTAFVPIGWVDAALLLVIALGLGWPGSLATALLLATWIGFVSDLLSGTLISQHALISLCAAAARVVSVHFNLHSAPTQMALAAGARRGGTGARRSPHSSRLKPARGAGAASRSSDTQW